jgi:hypothetical protein
MSSKIESWIDLTREKFKPVLNFMSEGHYLTWPMERNIHGAVESLTTQPVERVTVAFDIRFHLESKAGENVPICERSDRVVYTRTDGGDFKLEPSLSTATAKDVESFYDNLETKFSNADFLKFNLKGLIALATGQNHKGRSWLADYLRHSPDTPEARQLKTLLAAPR